MKLFEAHDPTQHREVALIMLLTISPTLLALVIAIIQLIIDLSMKGDSHA